jgi:glycosyltransferase involved in cell wall biosynthesis
LEQWLDQERLSAARFVGMVAQFIERKGHRFLLDAIPAIIERHSQVVFLLFGKGPLFDSIRERVAASETLSACVFLPGFRDDLEYCLPCLDILAHPAEMEGLGV